MGWQSFVPYGFAAACQLYCTDSESNYSRVGSKQIDERLKSAATIEDQERQFNAYNEAESEVLHLFGMVPIYTGPSLFVVKKGLANFGPAGFLTVDPQDIGWQK